MSVESVQRKPVMMRYLLMALYAIFLFSLPLKNAFFQASIGWINLIFFVTLVVRKEAVLFLKSLSGLPLMLTGLFFSMGLSSLMGISGMAGWEEMVKHVLRFWFFLLATIAFMRRGWLRREVLTGMLLAALCFHAINGMVQFFWGEDLFGRSLLVVEWGEDRLRGAVYNSNLYGFLMAAGLVLAFSLGFGKKRESFSVNHIFLWLFLFATCFWTLMQSGSRGAWFGAICGVLVAGSLTPGFWRRKSTLACGFFILILFVILFRTNALFQERMLATFSGNTTYRMDVWRDCWNYFLQSPFLGHGIASYARMERVYPEITSAHNIFMSILLELGLTGLMAYLFFFFMVFRRIFFFPENREIRPALMGVFTLILVYGQFGSTMITDKIFLSCWYLLVAFAWARPAEGEHFFP